MAGAACIRRGERHRLGAHAEIDHVAVADLVALPTGLDLAGAADVDGDQLAAIEKILGAGRLDRFQRERRADRHGAADDHAVVVGVGELMRPGSNRPAIWK